ncbi:MAG TPA: hypothetical protein VGN79_12370 [Devosia sp.]|jgi:hypothetical protein|nr:hypothetical protein [Devosia sp.]
MTLRYFLLQAPSQEQGITDAAAVGWVTMVDGIPATTPPTWCDLIPTTAYEAQAVYGEPDAEGVPTVISEAVLAPGAWFIASIQDGEPPNLIEPRIVASWEAGEPVPMPDGVVALSPVLSGMV